MSQSISTFPTLSSTSAFIQPRPHTAQDPQRQVFNEPLGQQAGQKLVISQATSRSSHQLTPPLSAGSFQTSKFQPGQFSAQQAIERYRSISQQDELSPYGEVLSRIDTRV